jgi:phosphatidate phosphatase APP1
MTEFEEKILSSLMAMSMQQQEQSRLQHEQARQLTTLALSQSRTTQALITVSEQQVEILAALSKQPEGTSITATLEQLLKPLVGALNDLSRRLPEPPARS